MVLFAQKFSDICKRSIRQFSAQVHNDLTRLYKLGISLLGSNIFRFYAKMLCHYINNKSGSDLLGLIRVDDILQSFFGQRKCQIYFI